MPPAQRQVWRDVANALAAPELKAAVFRKLAPDLALRFDIPESQVEKIVTFLQAIADCAISKVMRFRRIPMAGPRSVTLQLYLPRDRSQLGLGTALYKRGLSSLRGLFSLARPLSEGEAICLRPNSGYAFVVSNSMRRTRVGTAVKSCRPVPACEIRFSTCTSRTTVANTKSPRKGDAARFLQKTLDGLGSALRNELRPLF